MSIIVLLSLLVSLPQFYDASSNFFLPFFVKQSYLNINITAATFKKKKKKNCVIVERIQEQLLPQSPLTSSPGSRSLLTHILAEALALKCCQNGLSRRGGREQTPQHNSE